MMPTQQEPTATVRLPRHLLDELRPIAAAHDRSLSAELRVVLDTYIHGEGPAARRILELQLRRLEHEGD
jgi:plasmid stability protein